MITRCPVCRARLSGTEELATPCRRCGAELETVRICAAEAQALLARAQRAERMEQPNAAAEYARQSIARHDTPESRRVLARADTSND